MTWHRALGRIYKILIADRLGLLLTGAILPGAFTGCQKAEVGSDGAATELSQVPAVRLNYRYEADVPQPTETVGTTSGEVNVAVRSDFDQRRSDETLDKLIASPDGKRVVAIYHGQNDLPSEFRLDMYSADGKLLKKMTSELMAVHFPDTIRWSPDSANLAFVAMVRGTQENSDAVSMPPVGTAAGTPATADLEDDEASNANAATQSNAMPSVEPTPSAPTGILAFRTEQIYLADADGGGVRPITQSDGLIYFFYEWAPNSSGLVALAATQREWQYLQYNAEGKGEIYVPVGRPRLVEKNGRERRLDDALTAVHPVWSPDSSKIACAYDTQIRIYDAFGTAPTQAAIPLRNQLLLSAQAFDQAQAAKLEAEGNSAADRSNTASNSGSNSNQPAATLPDPATLVSFNPIVGLSWKEDNILYFQTAFIKRMNKETDSVTSFPRWHRLVLSPQAGESK